MGTRGTASDADLEEMLTANFAAARTRADVGGQLGYVRTDLGNVFDVLHTGLHAAQGPAALRTSVEPHFDLIVNLLGPRTKGRWMSRGTPRWLVLVRRLLVFVFAAKGRGLACGRPFQLFDPLLKLGDDLLKLGHAWFERFEFLKALTKRLVLRFELLDPKSAWVRIHAGFLTSRVPTAMSEVCAMDDDRASKKLL